MNEIKQNKPKFVDTLSISCAVLSAFVFAIFGFLFLILWCLELPMSDELQLVVVCVLIIVSLLIGICIERV